MSRFGQFVKALYSAWGSGITGTASAPLAIAALLVKDSTQKLAYGMFAGAFFLIANFLVWRTEREKRDALEQRLSGLPLIKLAPQGFYTQNRQLNIHEKLRDTDVTIRTITREMSCLLARFINDPASPTPDSIARDITATIRFEDAAGKELFWLDARWGDTDQPTPGTSTIDLQSVDFAIGQTREVDIAFKLPEVEDCYRVNNDSYGNPDFKDSRWRLQGTEFCATVRLRRPYVDKSWRFHFRNPGTEKNLEACDYKELSPTPPPAIQSLPC